MSAGGIALRVIVAVVVGVGVFFASMAVTLLLRASDHQSARNIVTDSPRITIEPDLSADPVVVAITVPFIEEPMMVTTTTIVLPVRTRTTPLPQLDEVFAPRADG